MKRWVVLALILTVCMGCLEAEEATEKDVSEATTIKTTSTVKQTTTWGLQTTTTTKLAASQASDSEASKQFVVAPGQGCECIQWICPSEEDERTTTVKYTTTSTTCVSIVDESYIPQTRYFNVRIRNGRFRPDRIDVSLGDTVVANITNKQGLHRIRETYSNRTLIVEPGESYELIFYALEQGTHLLTCNPFCEDPMEAKIVVSLPMKKLCN